MNRIVSVLLVTLLLIASAFGGQTPSFAAMSSGANPTGYLVGLKDTATLDDVLNSHANRILRVRYKYHTIPATVVEMTEADAQALQADSRVAFVEPDAFVVAQDTVTWGVTDVKADLTWTAGATGQGVSVALIDTGVAPHFDLGDVKQVAFGGLPTDGDSNGHGTHVAGIIGARSNSLGMVGVAPDVKLYSLKALDETGSGKYSDIIAALEWAVDNGVQVVNMSFGGERYSRAFEKAVAAANARGVFLVAAAGNQGGTTGDNTLLYPARYSGVVAVGAVDEDNTRASFSSVGPELSLMAPGVEIPSTLPDDLIGPKSGTSMAAPHVAGVAALVWSRKPSLKNDDVRDILMASARPLDGDPALTGAGLVDAQAAIATSEQPPSAWKDGRHDSKENPGVSSGVGKPGDLPMPKPVITPQPPSGPPSAGKDVTTASYATNQASYAPPAPDLWATHVDASTMTLSWSTQEANWFELDRFNAAASEWEVLYSGPNSSYTDTDFGGAQAVQYHVSARSWTGAWSSSSYNGGEILVYPSASYAGDQVTYTISTTATANTITVPASTGVQFYFYRNALRNGAWSGWALVQSGASNTYTDTAVSANQVGTAYSVLVKDAANNYRFTNGDGGSALVVQPPSVPSDLHATSITENSVSLSWTNQTSPLGDGSISYHCLIGTEDFGAVATPGCTISGLQANTIYTFSVYAVNAAWGQSRPSSITVRTGGASVSGYTLRDFSVDNHYVGGTFARQYPAGTYTQPYFVRAFIRGDIPSTWQEGTHYIMDGGTLLVGPAAVSDVANLTFSGASLAATITDSYVLAMTNPVQAADVGTSSLTGTAPYSFVIVAGMLTTDDFFDSLRARLLSDPLYTVNYVRPEVQIVYPYGKLSEGATESQTVALAWAQLEMIAWDILHQPTLTQWKQEHFCKLPIPSTLNPDPDYIQYCTYGGRAVSDLIGSSLGANSKLMVIGHSGGGVAGLRGVQLANLKKNLKMSRDQIRVFAVGSPYAFLGDDWDLVHYVVNSNDPIPVTGLPGLNEPASVDLVDTRNPEGDSDPVGAKIHMRYFSDHPSGVSGMNNIDLTLSYVSRYKP